jgi:hypothetical protein
MVYTAGNRIVHNKMITSLFEAYGKITSIAEVGPRERLLNYSAITVADVARERHAETARFKVVPDVELNAPAYFPDGEVNLLLEGDRGIAPQARMAMKKWNLRKTLRITTHLRWGCHSLKHRNRNDADLNGDAVTC